jgi:hypothetical protein
MITPSDNDDLQFISTANGFLAAAVAHYKPAEIYLVQVDGWFDAKWLRFSGKGLGAFGIWKQTTTIPPFHPNRVLNQNHLSLNTKTAVYEESKSNPIHGKRSSGENATRKISNLSTSAIFLWYSSTAKEADRASIMLYRSHGGEVFSWYASFHKSPLWKLDRCHGITATELTHLLGAAQPA